MNYLILEQCYLNEMKEIWCDKDVIKYTNIKTPCTSDEIKQKIDIFRSQDVFIVENNSQVIGIIGCPCIDKAKSEYGLFYQFKKSQWGKGYATAAVKWLIEYMKNKYCHMTLFADVVSSNTASEKILNKL